MAVLPKYQLKELFESGDLITETTLDEFIEAAYNPVLVAGSNVTLTTVSTPSGDTITISSTGGGGGDPIIEGSGIEITTVGSNKQIAVDLDTSQTNLIFNGLNELTFAGVHVEDEGTSVGTYKTFNFIGNDVLAEDSGTPGKVNVFIPTPTFASHFNTTDGTTTGTVSESGITRQNVRISSPTTEGSPFKTGGWAGTVQSAYDNSTTGTVSFSTAQRVTGFSASAAGDATITVTVYDADGVSILKSYTTPTLYQNGTNTNVDNDISVTVSSITSDSSRRQAVVTISVIAADVLNGAGLQGGRYHVEASMSVDTATDGSGTYTYTQSDVFFDINNLGGYPSTPTINGSVQISETLGSITTKHISGVEYYVAGSAFTIDVNDIDNLNANTQGRSGAAVWNFRTTGTDYGLSNLELTAWSPSVGTFTNWTNNWDQLNIDFDYNNWQITNNNFRFRNDDATVFAKVYDPWNAGSEPSSPGASILIDTYSSTGNSNSLRERFDDEEFRLTRGSSSYSAWNSTPALGSNISNQTGVGPFSDACVVGSNMIRADKFFADNGDTPAYATVISDLSTYKPDANGVNPNYSTYTNVPTFHRLFETTTQPSKVITSFELTFSGNFVSDAFTDLVNEDFKIYIRKKAAPVSANIGHGAVPHSLHGTGFNFANYTDPPSGVDAGNGSAQCRTGSTPGNVVEGTFGGSNAQEGFFVEIQIINANIRIDQIIATLNFSDGTQQTG